MKRAIAIVSICTLLSSCGTMSTLYNWGGTINGTTTYEHLAYQSYDKQTPESICKLLVAYEDMVTNQTGTRRMPPPGICAEYGYLLLQPQTAETFYKFATNAQKRVFKGTTDYGVFFREYGLRMLKKELEYYPESTKFIEPLIKRFSDL